MLAEAGKLKGNSRKEQIAIIQTSRSCCTPRLVFERDAAIARSGSSRRFAPKGSLEPKSDQSKKSRKSKKSFGLHLTPTTSAAQP